MWVINRLASRTNLALAGAGTLYHYLRHLKRVRALAKLSMLSEENLDRYLHTRCPICGSEEYHALLRMPFGYPPGQGHCALYYDYDSVDLEPILAVKESQDRAQGFVLSIPWNFCNRCKNGSLALALSQDHLDSYYAKYYHRTRPVHAHRRSTKQLHARYLCRFLGPESRVLEIGAADGFAAEYLASQGHKVTAYEPSANYHEILSNVPGVKLISEISAVPDGGMDAVYLHHVYEHISSPMEYARRLHGLLKPGGVLFIQVPDLSPQVGQYQRGLRRSVYSLLNPPVTYRDQIHYDFWSVNGSYRWLEALLNDHVSAFTHEGLRYVIEESGFEVEELTQSGADQVTEDRSRYSWPVDVSTGNTPNSLSLVARR